MLTIRTLFSEINIDNNKEYAIYHIHYYSDRHGNPLDKESAEVKNQTCYDCGDIIIETAKVRYIIKKVMDAYDWVVEILNYIDLKRSEGETDIYIDMNRLQKYDKNYVDFECGDCYLEHI